MMMFPIIPLTHSAEEDAGMGPRQDGLKPYAVAAALPWVLSPLKGHPLSHRHGADPSRLERVRVTPLVSQSG